MDLRKLNDASVHDTFPTPFTDEVLDNVGGQEVYSFTDGFSGYHQIRIHKDDRNKTMFDLLKKYVEALRLMLAKCRQHHISLNLKKCIFCVPFGIFMGHIVCRQGLMVDLAKIAIIVNLPPPSSVRQLCITLGHTGYYRKFIKGYV